MLEPISFEDILRRLEAVYRQVQEGSGIAFAFNREDRQKHSNSYTFYIKYTGPLPAENDVKVDITVREHLVFPLEERPILRGYEEFTDVPENRLIRVYSLEEIATEKLIALADRARTEPRDLYDFWYLTSNENVPLDHVSDAIHQKLRFRNKSLEGFQNSIQQKEARLKALWSTRLAHQMSSLPHFDDVFRAMRRALRQLNLP